MKASAGIRNWVPEIKSNPAHGVGGFGLGVVFGVMTEYLSRFRTDRHSVLDSIDGFWDKHKLANALFLVALFLYLLHTRKATGKPFEVFVFSLFAGVLVVVFICAVYGSIFAVG
jgi:hypothetical protein